RSSGAPRLRPRARCPRGGRDAGADACGVPPSTNRGSPRENRTAPEALLLLALRGRLAGRRARGLAGRPRRGGRGRGGGRGGGGRGGGGGGGVGARPAGPPVPSAEAVSAGAAESAAAVVVAAAAGGLAFASSPPRSDATTRRMMPTTTPPRAPRSAYFAEAEAC